MEAWEVCSRSPLCKVRSPRFAARSTSALSVCVVMFFCICVLATVSACQAAAGDNGFGDAYLPELGNGGYDVDHYDIVVRIDPSSNFIDAEVTISATSTQHLSSFNLDFAPLEVESVNVNGTRASYIQEANELIITPEGSLPAGHQFTVDIKYSGNPQPAETPILSIPVGWFHAQDGTINTMNWPDGAKTWLPGNHHPGDKATFRIQASVPEPWVIAGPGNELQVREAAGEKHYTFDMDVPMASGSAVLYVDEYEVTDLAGPSGVDIRSYVPKDAPSNVARSFEELTAMIEHFEGLYGQYPFERYSVVIADPDLPMCDGAASANGEQTISLHCPSLFATDRTTLVHELGHQWFGHSVTPSGFKDSWLAEGPATYTGWMWDDIQQSDRTLDKIVESKAIHYQLMSRPSAPIGEPPKGLITDALYTGGGLLLHALRSELGDETFFDVLREYLGRYQYSNASTDDFIAVAEQVSGRDLQTFFDNWLLEADVPVLSGVE